MADFVENYQKIQKSLTFIQKAPELIVSDHFMCADNINTPPVPNSIILYFKMRSELARFTQKQLKTRIFIVFIQNHSKSFILGRFKQADSTDALPTPSIAPT
jgi:hypothetical protein